MTFTDWSASKQQSSDPALAELFFGFVPDKFKSVLTYNGETDAVVELTDGTYFTIYDRSEYTGTLEEVEGALWRHINS